MANLRNLQRASFDGIEFPIKSVRIKQSGRKHLHVYLKTPGGATEKMGRGIYIVTMQAVFDVNIPGYGNLWPDKLEQLRRLSESQKTAKLVIPTIGTIDAWLPDWEQEADFEKRLSGELAPLNFEEDASQVFLTNALSKTTATSLGTASAALDSFTQELDPQPDIFQQINEAVNGILAIRDQADLFGALAASKIEQLALLVRTADATLTELQDPLNYQIVEALHDLLAALLDLANDITGNGTEARIYVTPKLMSVGEISSALYGNATHATELMQNNSLDDPLAVPAGERLLYFPDAA
jgi:hypothetical protein